MDFFETEEARRATTGAIADSLRYFLEPSEFAELRILNTSRGVVSGYFSDLETMAAAAAEWDGKGNVCMTMNPVSSDALGPAPNGLSEFAKQTTRDVEIARRRFLLLDFDPVRPSGVPANTSEHDAALQRARRCKDQLSDQGWPEPILADSGNGAHLLYRVDFANEPSSLSINRRVLQALARIHNDENVHLDEATANPARLTRVYGTMNVKGEASPERPHRRSEILSAPEELTTVPPDLIRQVASAHEQVLQVGSAPGFGVPNAADWLARNGVNVADKKVREDGTCVYVLERCPWNPDHTDRSAHVTQLANGALAAGCHHNSCQQYGWRELKDLFAPNNEACQRKPTMISAADLLDLKLPPMQWVVPAMIPVGLTVLAGKPKTGKSFLALQFALAVTCGAAGFHAGVERGSALLLAWEDGQRRLQERIRGMLNDHASSVNGLASLNILEQAPRLGSGLEDEIQGWLDGAFDARLIVLDTLTFARPSEERAKRAYDQDYEMMSSLKRIADTNQLAIVVLHHLRKQESADDIDAISGTLAIAGAADSILILRREAKKSRATLALRGRDIEESEVHMDWQAGGWSVVERDALELSDERQDIIEALSNGPSNPASLAKVLGLSQSSIRQLLQSMCRDGQVAKTGRGIYAVIDHDHIKAQTSGQPVIDAGITQSVISPDGDSLAVTHCVESGVTRDRDHVNGIPIVRNLQP